MINLIYCYLYIKYITQPKTPFRTNLSKIPSVYTYLLYKYTLILINWSKKKIFIYAHYVKKLTIIFNLVRWPVFSYFLSTKFKYFFSELNHLFVFYYIQLKNAHKNEHKSNFSIYLRRDILFKKYFYLFAFAFLKKVKNIFSKKKQIFLKKYFLLLIIFYLKQLVKKKNFLFFNSLFSINQIFTKKITYIFALK